MSKRLTIKDITPTTDEWTCKIQVVDRGRPRDSMDKTKKYQIMIFQDEEETQVQAIMWNTNITHFKDHFKLFHTYLVSVAQVKKSAYANSISEFTWTIDLSTIVEPIEKVVPPEAPLPPPSKLNLTPLNAVEYQDSKDSEFDVLAIVVNGELPKFAKNGKQIQDFLIMDYTRKPTKFTLWEDFLIEDGTKLFEQFHDYPVILAKRITRSLTGVATRYNTAIHIDPPHHQAEQMKEWVKSIKQKLTEYTIMSTSESGSLILIPFEEHVTSVVEVELLAQGKIFYVDGEISLVNKNQRFCSLSCSNCKLLLTRSVTAREIYCSSCKQLMPMVPRCEFEVMVTDKSGSTTATISNEAAEKLLCLPVKDIYDICCLKKKSLPFENIQKHLSGKVFRIQMKKMGKLQILTYTDKENTPSPLAVSTMGDFAEGSKRKFNHEASKETEDQNPVNRKDQSSKKKLEKRD